MRGVTSPGSIPVRLWFGLLLSCALPGLAACSVSSGQSAQPADNLSIRVERTANVPTGRMVFRPMPGQLFGKADNTRLFESARDVDTFEVPISELLPALGESAAITRSDAVNPGELAEPRELRMARIATFFEPEDTAAGCNNFRTGLRADWPAQATLVYVDRAGTVLGTRYAPPYVMEYNLVFPAAGVYAISTVARGNHVMQAMAKPGGLVARVRPAPCSPQVASRR